MHRNQHKSIAVKLRLSNYDPKYNFAVHDVKSRDIDLRNIIHSFYSILCKYRYLTIILFIFQIFVELAEYFEGGDASEWKQTARWIKYEEDVEEGVDRWGKPHVASLSFHSLLNLRRCLEEGLVILDLEEKDLPGIAYR